MLFLLFIFLVFHIPLQAETVAINEFMASNAVTLADEDGDYEDWIELYNYGTEEVHLQGWGLSDNYGIPFRWTFPDVTLQPGAFLLVWASGKDRTDSILHTNFSISSSGEPLLLVDPDGNWIDHAAPVELLTDITRGRQPDGTGDFYFFDDPTPGSPNTAQPYGEIVAPPLFSLPPGWYRDSVELVMYHPDPEVTLVYTLDGSDPSCDHFSTNHFNYKNQYVEKPDDIDGPILTFSYTTKPYQESLWLKDRSPDPDLLTGISSTFHNQPGYFPEEPVDKATVVRAKACKQDALSGGIADATYFITEKDPAENFSFLPVISLVTHPAFLFSYSKGIYVAGIDFDKWRDQHPGQDATWRSNANYKRRGRAWEYPATMQYFDTTGTLLLNQQIGYRIHGGWARSVPRKSFRFYARNHYGNDHLEFAFFDNLPYTAYRRLLLRNSGQDWGFSILRDAAIQTMFEHLNFDTQAYQPTTLFINGEYWGIMNLRERYDKHYLERVYGVDPENIDYLSNQSIVGEGDSIHFWDMIHFLQNNDMALDENFAHISTMMDVDNFTDYYIAQIFTGNKDWPHANLDMWRLRTESYVPDAPAGQDGRWRWLLYDMDATLGLWEDHTFNALENAADPEGETNTLIFRSLLENESYRVYFLQRFADLLNTSFRARYTTGIVDSMRNKIAPEIPRHISRWSHPDSEDQWNSWVNSLNNFLTARPPYAHAQNIEFFGIEEAITLDLNVSHNLHGHIRTSTVAIEPSTPGVAEEAYPWSGIYYRDIPVTLTAVSQKGYRFSHWSGDITGTDSVVDIVPGSDISVKAWFETTNTENLLYYWVFDTELPNNQPLSTIPASYGLYPGAFLEFRSSLPGYPYSEGHELWRMGSMERRNSPTPLNYRPEGNDHIPFQEAEMRGIQVRQPLETDGQQSELIFHLPTTGLTDLVFRFAAKDEGAAEAIALDFSFEEDESWYQARVYEFDTGLTETYKLFEFDLSRVRRAHDNPWFKIRIRFVSDTPNAMDGKRVTFNNFSLDGKICRAQDVVALSDNYGSIEPGGRNVFYDCTDNLFYLYPRENHIIKDLMLDGNSILDEVFIAPDGHTGMFNLTPLNSNSELVALFEMKPQLINDNYGLLVYPNPSQSFFDIATEERMNKIELFDMRGTRLLEVFLYNRQYRMNMSRFGAGIYLLLVTTEAGVYTEKIHHLEE